MIAEQIEHTASPEMRKFFERLLDLKNKMYLHAKMHDDIVLDEIYDELDSIIKMAQ